MPIPNPNKNEEQSAYIARCMGDAVMNKEYPDSKQRAAVCNTKWRDSKKTNMQLDTVNIGNVEIFESGEWKGAHYSEKDIDDMVKNFKDRVAEPYLTINHSAEASKQFKDALQSLSLGFVSNLFRKGKKLIADFKQVPKTIAELIAAGALKKKSIEFYKNFIANGKLYKNVLQGVTFHGADGLPEVNTLSDFLTLYKSNLQVMDTHNGIVSLKNSDLKKPTKGGKNMSMIELKQDEYNELLKLKSQYTTMQEENEKLQDENAEVKKENEDVKKEADDVKKENDDLKEDAKEVEKEKEENLKREAVAYIDDKIKNGFIRPSHKDRYVSEYITYKKDDKLFKDFQDDIESRTKIINFNNVDYKDNAGQTNFKYEPEKLNFQTGATINYEELNKQIESVMKAKNITFEQACIECGVATDKEFGYKKEA